MKRMPTRLQVWSITLFVLAALCVLASGVEGQQTEHGPHGAAPVASPSSTPVAIPGNQSSQQLGDGEALTLARICKLEAEGSLPDCTALYWIGRKRFGDEWLAGLLRYSTLYERTNARARRIAAAPDGDIPGASPRENARWRALRVHALELVAGKHPDSCPRAVHWGGTMDPPRAGTVPATCAAQKRTANTLYRLTVAEERQGATK